MLAFEVSVNGDRLCTASAANHCVLSAVLSWARRKPEVINFHVGGVAADDPKRHVDWTTPTIGVGDEVRIRVIDTDTFDPPDRRYVPGEEGAE